MKDKRPPPELAGAEAEIRDFALRFPEATEDTPWGERAIKVRGKTFVFMGGGEGSAFVMSVKLPASKAFALEYPFTSPTRCQSALNIAPLSACNVDPFGDARRRSYR